MCAASPKFSSVVSQRYHALPACLTPFGLPSSPPPPPYLLCSGRLREQVLRVLHLVKVGVLRWWIPGYVRHVRFVSAGGFVVMANS